MDGPRTCEDARAWSLTRVRQAWGSGHLHTPRVPDPQRAPFKAPSLTPLDRAPDGSRARVQGSEWSGALLAQHMGTSRNRYYVKLAQVWTGARALFGGALGFLQPDPQKHVSSQPRGFFGTLENEAAVGRDRAKGGTLTDPTAPNESRHGVRRLRSCSTGVSIPGRGAFFASPTRVSSDGGFSLSGVV